MNLILIEYPQNFKYKTNIESNKDIHWFQIRLQFGVEMSCRDARYLGAQVRA